MVLSQSLVQPNVKIHFCIFIIVNNNKSNPIPQWVVKGNKCLLPDGNMVIFTGKNDDDFCILVKDPNDKFHLNFTIKQDKYVLQTKDEQTGKHVSLLDLYSEAIIDLCNYWGKKRSNSVHVLPHKNWQKRIEQVIDINSTNNMPALRWQEGDYDINPEDVQKYSMLKDDVINLRFTAGLIFNDLGECLGMLMPHKKSKNLVQIDRSLLFTIFNTLIGMDKLKQSMLSEYRKYQNS